VIRAWCYREGVAGAADVSMDALPTPDQDTLLWLDCEGPTDEEITKLGDIFELHEFVIEDLRHAEQRTKLDQYRDHFHVAVHDCQLVEDVLVTREIDVVFGEGWLLSVRQPPEGEEGTPSEPFPVELVQRRFEAQRRDHGTTDEGFLLWAFLDVVVDRYFVVTDAVDERMDDVEEAVLDDTIDRLRRGRPRELFTIGKALLRFRRAALPLREVAGALLRREAPSVGDIALAHFQDLYDHVLRVADLVETQRDVITGLRDADLAVTSNQMSLVQQRIAAWGAILLIATLVTGVLGSNFASAPELDWEAGFAVIAVVFLLTGLPLYIYFKRKKWL
jgi:magnesium transporter